MVRMGIGTEREMRTDVIKKFESRDYKGNAELSKE
jgi:hypothetical protein